MSVEIQNDRCEKLARIQAALVKFDIQKLYVTHTFGKGIYTRTGKLKAGEVICGQMHKSRNIFTLTRGTLAICDRKNGPRVITAPYSVVIQPGTQQLGIALTDCEGSNIFETEQTTVEGVEQEMLCPFALPTLAAEMVMLMIEL